MAAFSPSTAYTLLLTAISAEFNAIKSLIQVEKEVTYLGRVLVIGTYKCTKLHVILTMSGVGPVNSAMTTQALISKYNIKRVLNIGIAGGVDDDLHIGDIVIPDSTGLYQQQVYARETSPGVYEPPPFLRGVDYGNFNFIFPQATEVLDGTITPAPPISMFIPASESLLKLAEKTLADVTLFQCVNVEGIQLCVEHEPKFRFDGSILSGPTFLDNAQYRQWLNDNPTLNLPNQPINAIDEESAIANFVCRQNNVPFLAIRALSDLAGGRADPNELVAFLPVSLANLQLVTDKILRALSRRRRRCCRKCCHHK